MLEKPLIEVMLSSTFRDLEAHRKYFSAVLKQHRLHVVEMEDDASLSDEDMIDASLRKVDFASAYICIIGKRYGQIRSCALRNPAELSLTELEFERATNRGIPITVLIMEPSYPVGDEQNEFDPSRRAKLQAFRERVGLPHRVTANFDCWEDFLKKVPTAVAELRHAIDRREADAGSLAARGDATASPIDETVPPAPPAFHTVMPFTQGHDFVGREQELARITRWAAGPNPLLVFEAIGGMGKSMVTYRWTDQLAPPIRADWAGRLWYSFYEEGASMNDFCVHALAYMECRSPRHFFGRKTSELESLLLRHLWDKPWLIVMDGLERVLVAYHRFDKAQLLDGEAVADPINTGRDPNRCIHPADDHLLQALATARSSKLLVSTRNMPAVLLNASGSPIAGVERERLSGLEPNDAELMMRGAGIKGSSPHMRHYLETHFECHPLMVGVVAGLVNAYVPAPGNFHRWLDDPKGAGAVDLTNLDGLVAKRDHILKAAYDALDPDERNLLGVLAFFSQSVSGEVLVALNPRRPTRPKEVTKPAPLLEHETMLQMSRTLTDSEEAPNTELGSERKIAARREVRLDRFKRETEAYRQYEAALARWRTSPELRDSDAWLGRTMVDLQRRGLVITDRLTARYDLHPMVRGFVRHALKGSDSAIMGRAVADYARSRTEVKYENAASLAELAQGIEIVTALTLGRHFKDASSAFIGEFSNAFDRLELYAEALALLRPFFSQGWNVLPDVIYDQPAQRIIADAAARCFIGLQQYREADALYHAVVISAIADGRLEAAGYYISQFAFTSEQIGHPFRRSRLLKLHRAAAQATADLPELADNTLRQGWLDYNRGEIASTRQILASLHSSLLEGGLKQEDVDRSNILQLELLVLQQEKCLSETNIEDALSKAVDWRNRFFERKLFFLKGIFLQSKGDDDRAVEAFERSIAMARQVNIVDSRCEAKYAVSLIAVGRCVEALSIVDQLSATDMPPHVELAECYLALDDKEAARRHALSGYQEAWGDGPPYAHHWDLEDCRGVLKAVGEPEPRLAPFDSAKVQPFDFEPDLYHLIAKTQAELAKESKQEEQSGDHIKNSVPPTLH